MYIKNDNPSFYETEKFEFFSTEIEIQHDCLLVLKYLETNRSRKPKIQAFWIEDVVETNDFTIIGALAPYRQVKHGK